MATEENHAKFPPKTRRELEDAYTCVAEGRLGAAIGHVERALEQVPHWAEAHYLRGMILEQMGLPQKAAPAFEQATRSDAVSYDVGWRKDRDVDPLGAGIVSRRRRSVAVPGECPEPSPEARQLLEDAYRAREAGMLGSALRLCGMALTRVPDWAGAHNLRGVILDDMGHSEEAIAAYLEALRLDPSFGEARRNLIQAEPGLGDDDGTCEVVAIRTFSHPSEAHIARGRLETEGIPAFIANDEIVSINWLFSSAVGWVRLCVRETDARRAIEILQAKPDPPPTDEALYDSPADPLCPMCGSAEVVYETYNLRRVYTAILLLKFPIPFRKERWICRTCGASWKPG
jgi:tetratricopeptide (TPR) repeat protein